MRYRTLFFVLSVLWAAACRQSEPAPTTDTLNTPVGVAADSLVRRVAIPSRVMQKVFNAYVILPESYYLDSTPLYYPVVYLLHGYGGSYDNWYSKVPGLRQYASAYDLIIVTPEGGANSWYLDSPLDSASRFATYIGQEVPSYVEENFRTRSGARFRAITGLSMGGHGALSIALDRPDLYGAAGSMSGVVDLRPFPERWELSRHLGVQVNAQQAAPAPDTADYWALHSVINLLDEGRPTPALFIDCGVEDQLLEVNRALHARLLELSTPHTYVERPGGHTWRYWEEAIGYQLLFFDRFFDQ